MTKRILATMLAVLMVISALMLAACTNSTPANTGDQQTAEQTQDTLRSLRRVMRLHGHTELHNAPTEDDDANGLDAGEDKIRKIVYDGQRVGIGGKR